MMRMQQYKRRRHNGARSLAQLCVEVDGCMGLAIKGTVLLGVAMISAEPAVAGGMERGGYSIDRLFDPQAFVASSSASYVMPHRKLDNVKDEQNPATFHNKNDKASGVSETENYVIPYASVKVGLGEHVDFLFDYSQPWGVHIRPGYNWMGKYSNIETKITSDNYAATFSFRFDAGQGQLRLIGGGFYQEIDGFKVRQIVPLEDGYGRTDVSADGVGWRMGVAYEIPEIALRASMVYNSAISYDLSGTADVSRLPAAYGGVPPFHTFGKAKMPQVLELKMQSGVAPGWLAFGSVKWVDWSVLQSIPLYKEGTDTPFDSLDLLFRDGYTISGGIGHKINDKMNVGAALTYDRGTQKGFGDQTDTYSLGAFVDYEPYKNCTLSLGGVVGILTSGHSATKVGPDGKLELNEAGVPYGGGISYDFGNDIFVAPYASLKVSF